MTARVLVVPQSEITNHVRAVDLIPAVREAYRLLARDEAELSPKYHWEFRVGRSAAFASHVAAYGMTAIKIATVRPSNVRYQLPTGISQIVLHKAETGEPLAIMDGKAVTVLRTAAAAAVGAIELARPKSRVLALFGPGAVGKACLEAVASSFPIERVHVVGIDSGEATRFVSAQSDTRDYTLVASEGEEAVRNADIVVTVTPATLPIVRSEWVLEGTHISAMGSDWSGKQELETKLLLRAVLVTDNRTQCLAIGEGNVPHEAGMLGEADIHAEIGEVLEGLRTGRTSEMQVTVFDSSGIALQDLAAARYIYQLAVERRVGTFVTL